MSTTPTKQQKVDWALLMSTIKPAHQVYFEHYRHAVITHIDGGHDSILMRYCDFAQPIKPEVVQHLVDRGVDCSQESVSGRTAFLCAAGNSTISPEVIDILVEGGCDPKQADQDGSNAFVMYAMTAPTGDAKGRRLALAVVNCYHKHGVEVNQVNIRSGYSPFLLAVVWHYKKFPIFVERLLEIGACPDQLNYQHESFIALERDKNKDPQMSLRALAMALEFGFDLTLLTSKDLEWLGLENVASVMAARNIDQLNCFGKTLNKVMKRRLKIRDTQNMMRGLYTDVGFYTDFSLEFDDSDDESQRSGLTHQYSMDSATNQEFLFTA